MRTTLDLDDPVLEDLRKLQKKEGGTLGSLASRLLAEALSSKTRRTPPPRLSWTARPMGLLTSLEDKEALHALLDGRDGE